MNPLIAVVGKGGTGKSTVSALLIRLLIEQGTRPVLAVDADPNNTLAPFMGLSCVKTIGEIRDDLLKEKEKVSGIPKERLLEMKVEECLEEANGFDLLTMGHSEGPGCYCYVNNLLRGALTRMRSSYRATVVDNAAGMEHLSRMNTKAIDCMVLVCEPTTVSARAAAKINTLADSLQVEVLRRVLVWNKVNGWEPPDFVRQLVNEERFDDVVILHANDEMARLSIEETNVMEIAIPDTVNGLLESCLRSPASAMKG